MLLLKQRSKLVMTAFIIIDNLIFFQSRLSGASIYVYLLGILGVWFFIRKDEFTNAFKALGIYTGIKIVFIILLMTISARII